MSEKPVFRSEGNTLYFCGKTPQEHEEGKHLGEGLCWVVMFGTDMAEQIASAWNSIYHPGVKLRRNLGSRWGTVGEAFKYTGGLRCWICLDCKAAMTADKDFCKFRRLGTKDACYNVRPPEPES